ncbi:MULTISPECIES: alanyl-tRNA editing protein [Aeribacillus]|uniref:alanyl-tRNA editing protein n=2 Tax=Bacillaceae TaxID=186817 RepID=UPI0007B4CA42|nr:MULTISPECIES: alanyl-tRNA editing protein [Aeribacillus]KZM57033.1 alanyl-tRNA editing protein [Aeribacillus pallidus]MED1440422.1 alanyl-tRNA editing protein [Aeribacillus composti]RZI51049.1 alanyl-tRNA editing protein [Aeribacillus pallidus]
MTREVFLEDSYKKEHQAEVIDIKENKIILDETIFYPSGGGQPHDTGMIKQGNEIFKVNKVQRENGQIVHYVDNAEKLKQGPVEILIDWDRRYKLMRYHTLLHVLAGYLYSKFGALATGNQIFEDRARIDFQFEEPLTDEQFNEVEEATNKLIQENHHVSIRTVSREEAEKIDGFIKTVINLLPPSIQNVRLVTIGDIDEQACGGTHVKETKEIGSFQISKIKSKGQNKKRLEVTLNTI